MPSSPATDVLRCGAVELARRIAAKEFSARSVCDAFIARIEQVNPTINAVVWPLFDEARAAADLADAAQRRGDVLGPLHGVPITVKENFDVAGTPSTMGMTARRKILAPSDGILVERLRRAGAIILGKTNVPQLMIWHECDNPLYGRTDNPWDLSRTPGGSTGGEGAIIAAGGSPLGIGGDLGGSIRVPCHFCGIHGIKPTSNRITRHGVVANLIGMETIPFQLGPMARHVEDLEVALRVMAEGLPHEPFQPDFAPTSLPRSADVAVEKMRIAYWEDDGYFTPSPAIRRAVRESVAALRIRGATVVEFQPPQIREALQLYFGICSADGGADGRRLSEGSEVDPRVARLFRLARFSRPMRTILAAYLQWNGQSLFAELLKYSRATSADEFWQLTAAAKAYSERFFELLDATGCDAMICPPHALPAMQHDKPFDLLAAASYCYLPNLLGAPAGVVSITRVRAGEETDRPYSRDPVFQKSIAVETGSAGLPIAVQVMAKHWREDVVLAVMQALETDFQNKPDFPNHFLPLCAAKKNNSEAT